MRARLVTLVVVAVAVAVGLVHTDLGREEIRGIGNDELAKLFTGGSSIGRVEGRRSAGRCRDQRARQ